MTFFPQKDIQTDRPTKVGIGAPRLEFKKKIFYDRNKKKQRYSAAGVPANNFLFAGRVPANNFLNAGRVPANNFLNAGRVPANNFLFAGRVPANNLFQENKNSCKMKGINLY